MDLSSGVPEWAGEYFLAAFLQRVDLSSSHWDARSVNTLMLPISLREKRLVVNIAYARSTEAILGLLLLLGIATMILQQKLTTNLKLNPNSVAGKCLLVHNSPGILSYIHTRGFGGQFQNPQNCHLCSCGEGRVKLEMTSNVNRSHDNSRGSAPNPGTHFLLKKVYFQIILTAFSLVVLAVVVSLWIVGKKHNGLPQSSFHINLDNVNQFAWTIVPVLCVIMIKFLWGLVDDHFRLLQPYISLAQNSASAKSSVSASYRSTMEGWIIAKAFLRKHYILASITTVSLANEVLVVAMGAVFRSRPVNAIRPVKGFANSTLRTAADVISFPDASQIYRLSETYIPVWDFPKNTMNFFYPEVLTISTVAWNGEPAPWTTVDYAFLPVIPGEVDGFLSSPGSSNWTVSTLGVRGIASCHGLDTPPHLFEEVPVSNDANKTVQFGLEIHDWRDGPENTNNTVRYQQSVFRIPSSRTGVRARRIEQKGTLQGIMNYTAFWGPLWSVNIDESGNISSMNISTLSSNSTISQSANSQQTIWNLPEMEPGYFAAGFVDFSRIQDLETSIWYSRKPVSAFVVCKPSFEYVAAQVILDGVSQRVLDYKLQGVPRVVDGSGYAKSWHDTNGNTPAQMGFGSAFTAASIFRTERPVSDSFVEPNFLADISSYVSSFHFDNLSQMVEPGKLEKATEAAFTALFSQFAAVPGNVFVPIDTPVLAQAGLITSETKILVSTTAMAIVVSILFTIVVALAALSYWTKLFKEPLRELERQPDTIASEIFWVCHSTNLLRLVAETERMTKEDRERHLNSAGRRFRIGKFIGAGRNLHFGIEVVEGTEWQDRGTELTPRAV